MTLIPLQIFRANAKAELGFSPIARCYKPVVRQGVFCNDTRRDTGEERWRKLAAHELCIPLSAGHSLLTKVFIQQK